VSGRSHDSDSTPKENAPYLEERNAAEKSGRIWTDRLCWVSPLHLLAIAQDLFVLSHVYTAAHASVMLE
jgi:hypothetical protein